MRAISAAVLRFGGCRRPASTSAIPPAISKTANPMTSTMMTQFLHQGESVATRERAGGVTLRFGDVVVNGGGDPRAVAEAVIEEVERRLRGASRLRVAVQDAARGR